jgi:nicotinate-nucleotide pyrophosphorylase (carboxylating)
LALREDLGVEGDHTSRALAPDEADGGAAVVSRQEGVIAGLPAVPATLQAIDPRLSFLPRAEDGQAIRPGDVVGVIAGPVRGLLAAERLVLNLLGRLSGIASLTRKYTAAVSGTRAQIYDTRKTTPGWRRLEKYAVRCGGGMNHRTGLFEAVLIKDNHLAVWAAGEDGSPAAAVARAREYAAAAGREEMIVEIEVDTLEQLAAVLPVGPDIVLLDNMIPATLREAVALRDAMNPGVELEASGGVNLQTIRVIAETGVERISIGALTHSAVSLDLGLDWLT